MCSQQALHVCDCSPGTLEGLRGDTGDSPFFGFLLGESLRPWQGSFLRDKWFLQTQSQVSLVSCHCQPLTVAYVMLPCGPRDLSGSTSHHFPFICSLTPATPAWCMTGTRGARSNLTSCALAFSPRNTYSPRSLHLFCHLSLSSNAIFPKSLLMT